MTLKLVFGFTSVPFSVNGNHTTKQVVQSAQNVIRNIFPVRDSRIEIVLGVSESFTEMRNKLPESDVLFHEFTTEQDPVLYARIIRTVNNIEYIKTYRNEVIYFKREDALNGFHDETPFLTERQMELLASGLETCTICYENSIDTTRSYSCRHLFCAACTTRWNTSCPLCRSDHI